MGNNNKMISYRLASFLLLCKTPKHAHDTNTHTHTHIAPTCTLNTRSIKKLNNAIQETNQKEGEQDLENNRGGN